MQMLKKDQQKLCPAVTLTKRTIALLETVLTENALQSKFSKKM